MSTRRLSSGSRMSTRRSSSGSRRSMRRSRRGSRMSTRRLSSGSRMSTRRSSSGSRRSMRRSSRGSRMSTRRLSSGSRMSTRRSSSGSRRSMRRSSRGSRMSTRQSSSGSRMTMSRFGTMPPPRAIGAVANELSRLEEGASSSSESDTSVSNRGSRRTKTSRRSRRRLKPRCDASPSPAPTESVCTIEYVDGVPSHTRVIEVTSPPRDAKSITSLPGLSWKNFLRDLKAGDTEQACLITDAESAPRVINAIELSDASSRPKSAEPKSAREKRFAAQAWEALKASGNPVYETAREFADVFPDKIPAVLPADRGVRHEIDLAPGANRPCP
ncbi:unnamed protein product [Phytophthora fragariaefolia]|uniref:Unnamed protein product n=1 Tax=Phytophthora fragariaefolia TaxID=1490495 RepID=A0A9W6Y3N6_9STRA|nr:unnamed protein product [Phytophthora fragariaefolia]